MSDRDRQILEAAHRAFSRYGLTKTTMADIAREAGVARQTLYNAYDGKEDVFRAVVRMVGEAALAQARDAFARLDTLSARIEVFFDLVPIATFDTLQHSPDAAALLEGMTETARAEIQAVSEQWIHLFTEEFAAHSAALAAQGLTAQTLADTFYASAKGMKYEAATREILLQRLAALKQMVLAVTKD